MVIKKGKGKQVAVLELMADNSTLTVSSIIKQTDSEFNDLATLKREGFISFDENVAECAKTCPCLTKKGEAFIDYIDTQRSSKALHDLTMNTILELKDHERAN